MATAPGFDSLQTVEVSVADLDERLGELPLPGVAKPRASVSELADGSIDLAEVHLVDDADSVRRVVNTRPEIPWLVQRRVSGTLAAIGGIAWQGQMICAVHQVSPRIWPTDAGITAFAVTVAPNAARERALARFLGEIGWSGVFSLQFLLAEGRAYPIDFNPRIYGSISLAIAAGLNLPAIWTDLLLGREPEVSGVPGRRRLSSHVRRCPRASLSVALGQTGGCPARGATPPPDRPFDLQPARSPARGGRCGRTC